MAKKCLPGMPCYEPVKVYTTYADGRKTSKAGPFSLPLASDNVSYTGTNLPYTGIQTDMTITEALELINSKLGPEAIFNLFLSAIDNNPALKATLCERIGTCP